MSDLSEQNSTEQREQSEKFPIIGLGASAGGLHALKRFFENMPDQNGMAFVVILHSPPPHESHAAEILQTATGMTVMQVKGPVRVEPDKVYVIPPTKQLTMSDGFIRLSEPVRAKGQQVAIDIYFRMLADAHQQHAVCVVLSGTGSDGTSGLKRIKERGGFAFAQEPEDAEYDSMPRQAIKTGMVDFVLPAAEMPEKLISLWRDASHIKLPPVEEESLLQAKEHLRLLVESAMDHAVYTMDADGRVDYWNKGAHALFGYTESEIIGRSAALLYTAEDRESKVLERELREASERGSAEDERWHVRKDGTRFYASGVLTLLRDERVEAGTAHGYAMIARDLTERKRQEASLVELTSQIERQARVFNTTLSSITDFAYIFDREGRFVYANQALLDLWGLKLDEAMGKNFYELQYPDDLASRLQQQIQQVFDTRQGLRDETPYTSPTGISGYYEYIFSPVIAADGTVEVVAGSTRDISERKQAEEDLRISRAELQNSHDELERRVAERTAALSETNDVLQEEVRERRRIEAERVELLRRVIFAQEDERRRIAREMHDQFGQNLSALTLKLAALKEEAGGQLKLREQLEILEAVAHQLDGDVDFLVWELRPTVLDDLGLPSALKAYVQNWSKHFGIPSELHVSGLKRVRLTGEIETVLYRITQEALNNTAKYARACKVDIILEHRDRHVSLIIEDDGVGFDAAQAFGPHDKGLGLIGMRERAALVGGTAEIESHPNKGTTVFIRIPVPLEEGGQGE